MCLALSVPLVMGGNDVSAKLDVGIKVLLVDDEVLVRAGTAIMLDELGHDVTEANSGKQALELLADHPHFDLIITDFRMPEMDGIVLISESRKILPELRAVLMTGYEAQDPRFAELGTTSLNKPFSLADLETAVINAQ
jgi:CheY-like chemotaxis protein